MDFQSVHALTDEASVLRSTAFSSYNPLRIHCGIATWIPHPRRLRYPAAGRIPIINPDGWNGYRLGGCCGEAFQCGLASSLLFEVEFYDG